MSFIRPRVVGPRKRIPNSSITPSSPKAGTSQPGSSRSFSFKKCGPRSSPCGNASYIRRSAKFIGRIGAELDVEAGRKAAHLAGLNALAVARGHLGSLDKVTRIVRLGVSVATSGDVRDQAKVADAASELLQEVFGKDDWLYGVASLPLGTPVELEVIFEVTN
jgi:YjgF/chorismate_mutase-like, putative endoribonuclease